MTLDQLKEQIKRQCTELEVGGFRPTNKVQESWLGRVSLFLPEEELPIDKNGNQMAPLGQFYLPSMPFVPETLSNISVLTVFMSPELEGDSDLMEGFWEIREYRNADDLVRKDFEGGIAWLKPFPLKAGLIEGDCPVWDGGGLTSDEEDAFLKLENDGDISDYYDVTSHVYGHKFGGYPSFCQSGVDLGPYEFVFQVSSDPKIRLNVIDGGSFTFWRHQMTGDWKLYYDFY